MIYLSLFFLIYTIALTYNKSKNMITISLIGIIFGWLISIFSYLFYLSKFNVYWAVFNDFYNFSKGTWNRIVLENFDALILIRLLNFGILLFLFSFLLFSISFTHSRSRINKLYYYIPLAILFIVQLCYYDPFIQLKLQNYFFSYEYASGMNYKRVTTIIDIIFQCTKFAQIIITFSLLIHYLIKNFRIHFIRQYTIFNIMCLFPITIIHIMMFWWAPAVLIRATQIDSFHNYLKPPMNAILFKYNIFTIISLIAFAAMVFAFSRYQTKQKQHHVEADEINKRINTASLGVKAFTHSIKNHLLAIRSETEYLKEKFKDDADTLYSLELIFKSCYYSYDMINNASSKLESIDIVLKPVKLHIPVELALQKLSSKDQAVNIEVIRLSHGSKALLDTSHMTEVCFNIIKNAIEAMHQTSDKQLTITIEDQDQWGCISIEDNGPGIPPENMNEIFSPFFSTKSSVSNWGVGLSYCHKIVTSHQGKIEVHSTVNKGTSFKILLPLY
ncbi:sensor histidine kinase [Paenibacillus pinisoli]|uniref:histidine kinase n=2 Tax=Paenibacillus pinisoli TaxID=1276110 RepID=A0A3A6PFP0_9BACL|nr:sensor histidine kinase [Paenibacillus pinisoli]